MRLTITGTPGTGKTTVSGELEGQGFNVVHLTEFLENHNVGEAVNGERDVPVDEMVSVFEKQDFDENIVVEGHLSHHISSDVCVVLRCRPDVLEERLSGRDYPDEKIRENVEAEKMDLILSEAVQNQETVYEIDTTEKSVDEVIDEIKDAVENKKERTGVVDWTGFL